MRRSTPSSSRPRSRPVSPNPRTTPVSSIDVTFNEPINTSSLTPGALSLTDNGNPVDVSGVSLTLVPGTTATYAIGDLSGLTAAVGAYTLTVDAADIEDQNGNAGAGPPLSTSWVVARHADDHLGQSGRYRLRHAAERDPARRDGQRARDIHLHTGRGTVLDAGDGQTLSVSFAPTDSTDYTTATAQATINVQQATPSFSGLASSQAIFSGTSSINLAGTITSNTSAIPPGNVSITIDGDTQTAAVQANGSFSATFDTQAIPASDTPYTITYAYAGGANFQSASDASTSLTVIAATIAPVSPNPRNTPVMNINLTFDPSILTVPLTSADLSLTDNGGPNLISGSVSFVHITSDAYEISGLSGLTTAEGTYSLTLNADGPPGSGRRRDHRVVVDLLADGHHPAHQYGQPAAADHHVHQLHRHGHGQRPERVER